MLPIIGVVIIFVCVFGVYIISGGKMEIIIHAAPHELGTIFGAAIGAYLIANPTPVLKSTFKELVIAFKGSKFNKDDYKDLLCLMFSLCKLMKSKGLIAVESHIEKPHDSTIFSKYPKIAHDHFAVDLICDTLRTLTMGLENPHTIEELIDKQLEKHHHESLGAGHALQAMADGLPALGIVAAVLGVIKTMASITEPPAVLGGMIGGALVGTFLGVFLAYGLVGPMASKIQAVHNQEQQLYFIIRDILVAHLKGMAPQVSVEMGRGQIPSHLQPTFAEIETATGDIKID